MKKVDLNKIIIIEYNKKYKDSINDFINECMFTFINRPYKKERIY